MEMRVKPRLSEIDPVIWHVADQQIGGIDTLLLGDKPTDSFRVWVSIVRGADGPEVEAQVVYPCRVCGWAAGCGSYGEDCHS